MAACATDSSVHPSSLSINTTALFHQRQETTPRDDWGRLLKCWSHSDCGACHSSDGFCGWCPTSGTCLPLPTDRLSRAIPLLSPLRYDDICALRSERFELRTSGLGCGVSTVTALTAIVTVFATIFGLLVLYGIVTLVRWSWILLRGARGGWEVLEDGKGVVWVRRRGWGRWWRVVTGTEGELEEEVVDGGTADGAQAWWRETRGQGNAEERRRLLG